MDWFDGFTRVNGRLQVIKVSKDGSQTITNPSELTQLSCSDKTIKRKVTTNFSEWQTVGAAEYLCGLLQAHAQNEHHRVYKFEYQGDFYLVPTLVLAQALFRPFKTSMEFLLRPQGLELLCFPTGNESISPVKFYKGILEYRASKQTSIQQPLQWMLLCKSARRAWNSFYLFACKGLIGLDLPEGSAKLVMHCIRGEEPNHLHVKSLTIINIETTEFPYDQIGSRTAKFLFHEGHLVDNTENNLYSKNDFSNGLETGNHALSDEEWEMILPILDNSNSLIGQKKQLKRREIIDVILTKLETGTPWRKLQFDNLNFNIVTWTYQQLKRDGRWGMIIEKLNALRGT